MITAPKIGDRVWTFCGSGHTPVECIIIDIVEIFTLKLKVPRGTFRSVHILEDKANCFHTKQELLDHLSDTAIPLPEEEAQ